MMILFTLLYVLVFFVLAALGVGASCLFISALVTVTSPSLALLVGAALVAISTAIMISVLIHRLASR